MHIKVFIISLIFCVALVLGAPASDPEKPVAISDELSSSLEEGKQDLQPAEFFWGPGPWDGPWGGPWGPFGPGPFGPGPFGPGPFGPWG